MRISDWSSDVCSSDLPDDAERTRAGTLLELLTPIIKAWSAQWCVTANDLAIQVLGGYGYTREYPVEQFYRDNRLNPIHEGSNGIQALDLLGRKVLKIGRAHVCTPVTNAHLVCRLPTENNKNTNMFTQHN